MVMVPLSGLYPLQLQNGNTPWPTIGLKKGPDTETYGTLLCDQLTALDVTHRRTKLIEHTEVPVEVDSLIQAVLGYK